MNNTLVKFLTLLCGMLCVLYANAQDKEWTFTNSDTMCSVFSSGSVPVGENEYDTTYYVRGKSAQEVLQNLNDGERISVSVAIRNAEYSIPIKETDKHFSLKHKLLKTCEEHFV